jgi:hypothetical protein
MLIALTLEKSQLSKLLIALTQGCRSDTRKHQELTSMHVAHVHDDSSERLVQEVEGVKHRDLPAHKEQLIRWTS